MKFEKKEKILLEEQDTVPEITSNSFNVLFYHVDIYQAIWTDQWAF